MTRTIRCDYLYCVKIWSYIWVLCHAGNQKMKYWYIYVLETSLHITYRHLTRYTVIMVLLVSIWVKVIVRCVMEAGKIWTTSVCVDPISYVKY